MDKASLQIKYDDLRKKYNSVHSKAQVKIDEIGKKLKMQQSKVVKPLIQEMKVNEELTSRLKTQFDQNIQLLQKLSAIIRIPTMTNEFQRMLRTKENKQVREEKEKQTISQMVKWNVTNEQTQAKFLKEMLAAMDQIKTLQTTDKTQDFNREIIRERILGNKLSPNRTLTDGAIALIDTKSLSPLVTDTIQSD